MRKPELLAPAGDLEKLKVAVKYGANAVYLGGQNFSLRQASKNFTLEELREGIEFAHQNFAKVYVTANIFARNDDFDELESFFIDVYDLGADALIISDPGVFMLAKETVPELDIHISTQANNMNYKAAMFWHELGAKRIVVSRELSLAEISKISQKTPEDFEIEAFVHGAMCISYSGRCLLSNYMSGRDSNKGQCVQSCRWKYHLVEETRPNEFYPIYEDENGTYIFNSKDLCMIKHIPELLFAGVNSFKIEGRMKTAYYVATTVKAYREAIDDYYSDPVKYNDKLSYYFEEASKASHRRFTTAFCLDEPTSEAQNYETSSYIREYDFIGVVKKYDELKQLALIEQRNKFVLGDEVEFLLTEGGGFKQTITEMYTIYMEEISEASHPKELLWIKVNKHVSEFDMIRKSSL